MSKYECGYTLWIMSGYASAYDNLSPKDYLNCEDEDELHDAIIESLRDYINTGDINIKDCDVAIDIPKEFINEWKNLKGYE